MRIAPLVFRTIPRTVPAVVSDRRLRHGSRHQWSLPVGCVVFAAGCAGSTPPAASGGSVPSVVAPAGSTGTTVSAVPPVASNLFVVDAVSGSAAELSTGEWRLDLRGATVLWFADRPARASGFESISSFVSSWPSTFTGPTPNAAVLAPAGQLGDHPSAVSLRAASFDEPTGVASFTIKLNPGQSAADSAWLSQLTLPRAAANGRVVLFVDNGSGALPQPSNPGPSRRPSPAEQVEAATAQGTSAIVVLQAIVAAGGPEAPAAAESLRALAEQASEPIPAPPLAAPTP